VARIHVIPNGVDTQVFKPLPNITRTQFRLITTASSDQPLKGLSVLLRAFAGLREIFPQLQLVVIGKLKPNGSTQKELTELGLDDCVEFLSGISTTELVEQYAQACVAIVPSLYEGFGLPAAEAQACAIPLVCSDGGALPEVVGDAARMVKAGSVDELQQALHDLLINQAESNRLGEAGREHIVQQLSWQCVATQMLAYYRAILEEPGVNAHN
jgi:glycosyltransferase involved in cell wall biosynthesis